MLVQISHLSMEHIEVVWQNVETMRDAYVKKRYDPTRGGVRLSKGHLYCPVFKGMFHDIFFLDLPSNRVLSGVPDLLDVDMADHNVIDVPSVVNVANVPDVAAANGSAGNSNGNSNCNAPATPVAGFKRSRMTQEGSQ